MSAPDFDWSLMRSFLAVIETGSLQAAARRLGSTQPTVGRHVMQLEAQLGRALFERTGRKLLPTQVAVLIADSERTMADGADGVARVLSASKEDATGTVRISASQPVANHLLPAVLSEVRTQHPGLQLEVVVTNSVSNLLRREADIAIRMVRPEQKSLVARKLGVVGLGVYASAVYLKRRGEPRSLADLVSHDLIGMDADDTLLRGFAALGMPIAREAFVLRCDDHATTWNMLRSGLGIGFVSHYVGRTDPLVQRLLPDLQIPSLPMWLAVHREIRGGSAIRAVFDALAMGLPKLIE